MSNQITPNPSVPSQVVAEVKFPKFINNLGIIPTSYKDSMSYYECLAWLCKFLEEQVIPTVNENGEAVEELQALYVELNSYVTHYFDTLDVQEEINNKLDDMVEAGTLQEIIADYLNSKAVFGYDTVADMKSATNLIDGSYAKTLGYYSKNDGGEGLYKIRTIALGDTIDEMFKISISETLLAELIIKNNTINVKQFGCKGDNETDDGLKLQKAFQSEYNVYIPKGTYITNETLNVTTNKEIYGDGKNDSIIKAKANFQSEKDMFILSNLTNANIHDFGLSGNIDENPIGNIYNDQHGIHIFDILECSNIDVHNMKIFDNAYCGIRLRSSSENITSENIRIYNNDFKNVDCCFISLSIYSFIIKNIFIYENLMNGHSKSEPIAFFHVGSFENIEINNNIMLNKTHANAILSKDINTLSGKKINISNNIIDSFSTGINLNYCSEININNNMFLDSISKFYTGIILKNCNNAIIDGNYLTSIRLKAIDVSSSNNVNISNNKCVKLNTEDANSYVPLIYINGSSYINTSNNEAKKYPNLSTNLTCVYMIIGNCDYLNINEMQNKSDVNTGFYISGTATQTLTNSTIHTNLPILGNFNETYITNSSNDFYQESNAIANAISLSYSYRFARRINCEVNTRTLSNLTAYNVKNYLVIDIYVQPHASNDVITLTSSDTENGIIFKTDRTENKPFHVKLLYLNQRWYEV